MVLTLLLDPGGDPEPLRASRRAFDDALARVRANATSGEERPIIAEVGRGYEAYDEAGRALFDPADDASLAAYNARVLPAFLAVEARVWRLVEVNRRARFAADERSRKLAVRSGIWLGALAVVALVSLVLLSRWLQRGFLDRLTELQRVADAAAGGDERRRVSVIGHDELARVALRLNEALDARVATRREMQGRVNQLRELVVARLPETSRGTALFGTDGRGLVAVPDLAEERLETAERWIREEGREAAGRGPAGTQLPEQGGRLRLLHTDGGRAVAWLLESPGLEPAVRAAPESAP